MTILMLSVFLSEYSPFLTLEKNCWINPPQGNSWLTQGDPWVTKGYPWVTQGNSWVTPGYNWVTSCLKVHHGSF